MGTAGSWQRTAEHLRTQADACRRMGSALYWVLLDRAADDLLDGGPTAAVLAGHEHDPGPSGLALRLAGAVHAVAQSGRASALAGHYPSTGGDGDAEAAWPAFRDVLVTHAAEVARALAHPPQTNEVGRSAALLAGLLHVPVASRTPVRLVEIGASAGLNLRADRYRVQRSDGSWAGPAASPVRLAGAWRTPVPPGWPRVVSRTGCDVAPMDAADPATALRLAAFVWPDQVDRHERLRGALEVARDVPVDLRQQGAGEMLAGVDLVDGHLTVVWHSLVRQYLDAPEQREVSDQLDRLAAAATPSCPFAHVALEPRRPSPGEPHRFLVTVREAPAGASRVVAEAAAHGIPVGPPPAGC